MVETETPKAILTVEDLKLRFYTYEGIVDALDGVNFKLREGETLGIVGETGCGKSVTSLAILVLVPTPGRIEGGQVLFVQKDGEVNLLDQKEDYLRKVRGNDISMVFQEPRAYLNPVYTVKDQIAEVLMHHRKGELIQNVLSEIEKEIGEKEEKQAKGKSKKKEDKDIYRRNFEWRVYQFMLKNPNALRLKIDEKIPMMSRYKRRLDRELHREVIRILREMEMADPERVADSYPHELSGGMAQRVVIAMALACNPKLLIADEPTTNLDVTVQLQILNLIRALKKKIGSSIMYITHDLGVVAELCDRVAVMYAGVVCEIADVVELFKKPLHPYTRALLQSIPRPGQEFRSIEGTVPSLINPPEGCRFHTRCRYAMDVCQSVKPKIIEVSEGHYVTCFLHGGGSNE